ncbi:predicted protein [Sclerotinia sclerotiorum 1980 UF-70]|uniref:Uncharacterized protein n=1 Tax=Sclerotinia sclerotiorum (strain ATCC 18683 / 1980 / Ss-1) TaxID=665079 RepID=A7E6D8_SCLS1|nr:predicted protein [Sclerotinia sclerotiorum 1980 UF-70]EDN91460.1 predicted protein [Sclerotinia sclerotiorum 1980 UF-70]
MGVNFRFVIRKWIRGVLVLVLVEKPQSTRGLQRRKLIRALSPGLLRHASVALEFDSCEREEKGEVFGNK